MVTNVDEQLPVEYDTKWPHSEAILIAASEAQYQLVTNDGLSLEERLADSNQAALSHAEFVGLLVQDEKIYRDNLRLRRLLKKAKLRQEASLEDIDYRASRSINQQVMLELANPQWVAAHHNVLISGPTGVGKSFIACALGNAAARAGYTVLYIRVPRLFETL